MSHLQQGYLPSDDLEDVHPDLLSRYYGTEGPRLRRRPGQTGAGHYDADSNPGSEDTQDTDGEDIDVENAGMGVDNEDTEADGDATAEEDSVDTTDDEDADRADEAMDDDIDVGQELEEHITADQEHHVRHPPIPVPESGCPFESPELLQTFWECLQEVQRQDIIPEHYSLREDEWEDGSYGDEETVSFGRRGRKVDVPLPFRIWYPRAARWAQGLEVMTELLMMQEGEI